MAALLGLVFLGFAGVVISDRQFGTNFVETILSYLPESE